MKRFPVALMLLLACPALAQEEVGSHRFAVSVTGGLTVGSSRGSFGGMMGRFGFGGHSGAGLALGGGLAYDFSPRVTLEAAGAWYDRGRNAEAWSADAGFRLNLRPTGQSVVPYLGVTAGVYQARYEGPGFERPDVRIQPARVGMGQMPTAPGRGGQFPVPLPMVQVVPVRPIGEPVEGTRTDAMLSFGGGVRFDAGARVFVRPDVRAQVVLGGDTQVYGLFTLNFGYRF